MSERRVLVCGAGLMGHGMAKNILNKGFPLTVLAHRNRQPVEDLLARGAKEAQSAAELARGVDVVILCVTGTPQVEDALFRREGLLEGLPRRVPDAVVRRRDVHHVRSVDVDRQLRLLHRRHSLHESRVL